MNNDLIVKALTVFGIALLILLGVAANIGFHTLILHQPAKCSFAKCVILVKP